MEPKLEAVGCPCFVRGLPSGLVAGRKLQVTPGSVVTRSPMLGGEILGLHDPADGHVHARPPPRLPRLVGAMTFPNAMGAVLNVLLIDRAHSPRHPPLDHCVLNRRSPHGPLAAIRLVEPRPLHGRRQWGDGPALLGVDDLIIFSRPCNGLRCNHLSHVSHVSAGRRPTTAFCVP